MEVSKREMIQLLEKDLSRYEREEKKDAQMTDICGDGKFISNGNPGAWLAKQRKIEVIKAIISLIKNSNA
jgi:hypothetical protein